MSSTAIPTTRRSLSLVRAEPAEQAYRLLRVLYAAAPIAFGLDKFAEVLTHWPKYLAPAFNDIIPGTAAQAMHAVGIVEILAGVLVAVRPAIGSLVVAGWLGGIVVDLLVLGGYGDVALRDAGLLVGALALSRLAAGRER